MLLYGASEEVSAWVSKQIFQDYSRFKGAEAIGVVHNNKIICGVTYEDFQYNTSGKPFSCEMSIASIDKRWATRHNLRAFFKYPFIQLALERVWTRCSVKSEGVIMTAKRLGFKQEGVHPKGHHSGDDLMTLGLLKEDCRWIKWD